MSTMVFTDAKVYVGGYNVSGYANEATLSLSPDMLNETTFGNTTTKNKPGMLSLKGGVKGFMDYTYPLGSPNGDTLNSLDSLTFSKLTDGVLTDVLTMAPVGNAEGDLAYFCQHVSSRYMPLSGAVGQLIPYELDFNAIGTRLIRGQVGMTGVKTSTGSGVGASGLNVSGGVLSTQRLYAAVHVISTSGTTPSLTVVVESAAANTFASPTTRITFSPFTTSVGSSWQSVAGAITDTWFRMRWTISGGTPSFTVFGAIGVL